MSFPEDDRTHRTEADAIAAVALRGAEPSSISPHLFTLVRADGGVEVIDVREHDRDWLPTRDRACGEAIVRDVRSFGIYYGKWAPLDAEIFADLDGLRVVGVIDAGGPTGPGWGAHSVILELQKSVAWKAWAAIDGRLLEQVAFSEHIEDRLLDITDPVAADILELAQDFHVASTGRFQSRQPLAGGSTSFTYVDSQDARSGSGGKLEIPKQLTLYLEPFVGAAPVELAARFRYRLTEGRLLLGVKLSRPEDVLRSAFGDICAQVDSATSAPVLQGRRLR